MDEKEKIEAEIMLKKQNDFLAYVIKDMIAGMRTESSISLEFMNRSKRNNFHIITTQNSDETEITEELEELGSPGL